MDELVWAEGVEVGNTPALLEAVIDAVPAALLLFDRGGRCVAANRGYIDLFGRRPPADFNVLADPISQRKGIAARFERAVAGERCSVPELWYDPAERASTELHAGRRLHLQAMLVPIRAATGEVSHVAWFTRDVTDLRNDRDDIERQRDQLRSEVAQRAAVEGELRASEAAFAAAQRMNRIGSWELDLAGPDAVSSAALRWSDEVFRTYGFAPGAIEPSVDVFLSLVHPDDRARVQDDLRRCVDQGRYDLDARIRRVDGAERIVHAEAVVERDAAGQPRRVLGTVQDVTEQRLAESVLRESEERLQMALTDGRMVAWEIDVATGGLFLSRNAGDVLGLIPGDRVTHLREVARLVHPDDLAAISSALAAAGEGAGLADVAVRVTRPIDGKTIWMKGRSHPESPAGGPRPRIRGLAIDVTDEKRLDDALRASEFRYRTLVERAPEGIVVLDIDAGHFVEANASAIRMFGWTRDELCRLGPQHVSPEVQPDGRPSDVAAFGYLTEALEGKTPTFEWTHLHASKREILCEVRLVRIPAENRRLVRGSILDITARKRLGELRARSAELEVQNRRIREASRLKSEFLANMSHELRTPLNAIIGFAELLYDGHVPADAPQFHEFLGDILTSGRHLLQLINDVLDLSKIEAGKTEFRAAPIDVARLIGEVVAIVRTPASRGRIAVSVAVDPALDDVRLDPARLKQVLYNYLSNALKFTPAGGRVVVRASAEGADRLRIEVEDNGIGIAAADVGRLFVEFQQLHPDHRQTGTGLGLAVTRRLVEAQGGAVGVVSTPGRGSTFSAVLPRQFGGEVTRRARATTGSPLLRRVLVVDDEPDDQQRIASALTTAGYDVIVAETAAEALVHARDHLPDAVTIDLLLPDASGLELIRDLRASSSGRELPIVVVTVVPDAGAVAGLGIRDVLGKPVDPAALIEALVRAGVAPSGPGVDDGTGRPS